MFAVEFAQRVLSWEENLTSEEQPPIWMYHLDDELEAWFERIKVERETKYGISPDDSSSEMMSNEYSRGRR